jgi:surface protein
MFFGCNVVTSLDVSSFDTSNVTDMKYMFYRCNTVTNLDISSFDISNVTDMQHMFNECSEITNIQLPTGAPTATFASIFEDCSKLECLNRIDTTNATDTTDMFVGCTSLTAPNSTDQSNILAGASWVNPNSCP